MAVHEPVGKQWVKLSIMVVVSLITEIFEACKGSVFEPTLTFPQPIGVCFKSLPMFLAAFLPAVT